MLIAEFFCGPFFVLDLSSNFFFVSGEVFVVGNLEYAESDLTDSTETRSLDSSDEGDEENREESLEAAAVYKQVEVKPRFKLDSIIKIGIKSILVIGHGILLFYGFLVLMDWHTR